MTLVDTPATSPDSGPSSASTARPPTALAVVGVIVWIAALAIGRQWALELMDEGRKIVLFTPPVLGGDRVDLPLAILLPIGVAAVIVAVLPWLVERARWSMVVASSTIAAAAWWVSLAVVDGLEGLTRGLYWQADYADAVPRAAADTGGFLETYVTELPSYPIALRGHPPGFVLAFAALDRVGLTGEGWATVITLLGGLSAVAAVLVTVRALAGEAVARHAAPFVVLAPAALWIATSTDALTMGSAAWVVALVVLAARRHDRTGDALAAAAGLLAAFTALQSYGLVLMAIPIALIAVVERRVRPMIVAGGVAFAATMALWLVGFSWFEGLFATIEEYHVLDVDRPYLPFVFINVAAWALAIGPATVVGLAITRDRRLWLVTAVGLSAALAANISGLSSGEVERIWLPFTIWVLPAGAALWSSRRAARAWLSAQAAVAIAVTSLIATNW